MFDDQPPVPNLQSSTLRVLFPLFLLLSSLAASGQDSARVVLPDGDVVNDDRITVGKVSLGGITGVESGIDPAWTARYYVGFRAFDRMYMAPLTTAATRGSDGVIRVSVNGLALVPAILFIKAHAVPAAIIVMLPQILLNPTIDQPIIGKTLSLALSGRTDWYAFSRGSKIYMEGSAGLRLRLGKLVLEGRFLLPIVDGYLDNRDPMVGVNVYYGGVR